PVDARFWRTRRGRPGLRAAVCRTADADAGLSPHRSAARAAGRALAGAAAAGRTFSAAGRGRVRAERTSNRAGRPRRAEGDRAMATNGVKMPPRERGETVYAAAL